MYEDSHINQVSFTPYRHPTEYLRCDIYHVDDMQLQNASSQTQTHTPTKHTPHPRIPAIHHPIPAPTDGKSAKHAVYLNSQRRAMRY